MKVYRCLCLRYGLMRGRVRAVGVAALGAVWAASGGPVGSACADARSNNIPPSDLQPEASPWVYPELKKGIEARREKENRLRRYVARLGPRLLKMRERVASECQNATPEVPESEKVSRHPRSAEGRCKALVSEYEQIVRRVERETAELTWGSVDAQARRLQFTRGTVLLPKTATARTWKKHVARECLACLLLKFHLWLI